MTEYTNKEKNCNWYFAEHSGMLKGPNNALEENFKQYPYYSIVREALQNSLDAINDFASPVIVKFKFDEINRLEYPKLIEELSQHIKLSKEFWENNPDAQTKFEEMIKYLDGEIENKKRLKIPVLVVSDYNTVGMEYDKENPNKSFTAFLRSEGNSAKNNSEAGGSFGFGKAAYFSLSPLRTILVSTKNRSGQYIFEGATVLATHNSPEKGKKLTAYGFYNCGNDAPVTDESQIPDKFKRNETGTSVYIIGYRDHENQKEIKEKMIKAVLNNFWLAIHENKLVVEIEDVTIDKDSLYELIENYYANEIEPGSYNNIENWNPKPYYKSVKNKEIANGKYYYFEEELKIAGKVKLYVYANKGLPDRVAYFRKPLMLVYKKNNKKLKGYAAVFVCEGKGNEILRKMENPAHNEWKPENYKKEGKTAKEAKEIMKEINKFINEKLMELSGTNFSDRLTIEGLEEYLNIPAELLSNEEDFDYKGNNENTKAGEVSDLFSEQETGVQTTELSEIKIKPVIKKLSTIKIDFSGERNLNGETVELFSGGELNESDGGTKLGGIGDAVNEDMVLHEGKEILSIPLSIKFRVIKSGQDYILIIDSPDRIDNAEIKIFAGTDNGNDEPLKISKVRLEDNSNRSVKIKINKNIISGLKLNKGKNKITIIFEDDIQYSLKLKAYELR